MAIEELKDQPAPPQEEANEGSAPEEKKPEGNELSQRSEPEDFQELYQESLKPLEEGQILKGTVIDITPDHVTVDVGYKSEGQIPIREFLRRDKRVDVKIGDHIEVLLEKIESEEGLLVLSKGQRRAFRRSWRSRRFFAWIPD
jgi:small subunit ribosomal protein S1